MGQEVPNTAVQGDVQKRNRQDEKWGPREMMNRVELIKLLQDSIERLGYPQVSAMLQQQSGVEMQPEYASTFRKKVLSGDHEGALGVLQNFGANRETEAHVKFMVRQQQFFEMLAQNQQESALQVLRLHMAGLGVREQQLQILASLFLNPMRDEGVYWERGANPQAGRTKLLQDLQQYLPPAKLIPPGRIEELIERALTAQVEQCLYSNDPHPDLNLLEDYTAGEEQLPLVKLQSLKENNNEVWHVQFSEDGNWLCSSCKDGAVRIYKVVPANAPDNQKHEWHLELVHILRGHGQGHPYFSLWDPQGGRLLSVGSDDSILIWNVKDGTVLQECRAHSDVLLSCTWLSNGCGFLSGGKDKQLIHYSPDGVVMSKRTINRVNDMVVNSNNKILVTLMQESHISFQRITYRKVTKSSEGECEGGGLDSGGECSGSQLNFQQVEIALEEKQLVMSICLSRNDQFLLVTLQNHTMHLWAVGKLLAAISDGATHSAELEPLLPSSQVMNYHASERSTRFQLKGMFGGCQERFVILGAEDCKIYIWHRDSGVKLATLFEHSGPVNCVSWNPNNPHLVASASDDKSVNIWGAEVLIEHQKISNQ